MRLVERAAEILSEALKGSVGSTERAILASEIDMVLRDYGFSVLFHYEGK